MNRHILTVSGTRDKVRRQLNQTKLSLARSTNFCFQIFLVANIFIVEMCCHPSPDQVQQPNAEKLIDVQDTDDEFVIKKPQQVNQPQYKEFLDTLYRQDSVKNSDKKTKRETADELPVEDAMEYVIPEKPKSGVDENYDKFISNLYSQDTEKHVSQQSNLHRQKRALIFRHEHRWTHQKDKI